MRDRCLHGKSTFIPQDEWYSRIIVQLPAIHQHLIAFEIPDAMRKATPNNLSRNIVPAPYYKGSHAGGIKTVAKYRNVNNPKNLGSASFIPAYTQEQLGAFLLSLSAHPRKSLELHSTLEVCSELLHNRKLAKTAAY